jgi:anti-sigma regulatory factor (Ser/Thr protein kinase)
MTAPLPRDRNCASVARRLLAQHVHDDLTPRELEDASLIVSELATNAFLHGHGAIVLKLLRSDARLRLEIRDEGNTPRIDVVPEADRDISGRGLWLVSQLGSDWGIVGSTHVWAELALSA